VTGCVLHVFESDVARLSPFVHRHIKVHGSYTFTTAKLPRGLRALHDPDALAEDDG
jgi:hypothetical protein